MTSTTRVLPARVEDPYSEAGSRLAQHRPDLTALALHSELGRLLLSPESEFALMSRAAGIPAERLVLELVSVTRRKPEILKCTPESIMTFMFDAAKLGLTIGRGVFPVPVKKNLERGRHEYRLEAWVGYKGAKELVLSSGAIRDCWAQVVYEGDGYEEEKLPVPRVTRHTEGPHFGDMSHAVGVYAVALFPGGHTRHKYLSKAKVEELRSRNRGDTTAATSPWVTNPADMWAAKAILQLTKDMPQTTRLGHLQALLDRDDGCSAISAVATELGAGQAPGEEVAPARDPAPDPIEVPAEQDASQDRRTVADAEAVTVRVKGGSTRALRDFRTSALEGLRDWARRGLEEDPEAAALRRVAEGCTVILDARASGASAEPPKRG